MPQIDLSSLNGPELRRLLDSARERGHASQSYQILEEMARRRESRGPRPLATPRRRPEPRIINVDLGDPLERREDPFEEAGPEPAFEPLPPLNPPEGRPPRRRSLHLISFVGGGLLGGLLGATIAVIATAPPAPASNAELTAIQAETAATRPAPAATPAPPQLSLDVSAPAATDPANAAAPPQASTTAPAEVATEPEPEAARAAEPAQSAPETAAAPPSAACAGATSPADRAICADPELQRLQRDLRRAYAAALDAHEDRSLLRQRQLAWRDARNSVADPARLAELYKQRIRRLDAATEDARRH